MNNYLQRLLGLIDHLTLVVRGLRAIAGIFLLAALLGGFLFFVGFLRAGWWWWLGLVLGLGVSFPALILWRFRAGLEPALAIPAQLRELPTSVDDVKDDLVPFIEALSTVVDKPKTPRAFIHSVRGTKAAIEAFNDSTYGRLLGGVTVLHPAALLAGGTATMFATGSLALGATMFFLGGIG